MKEAINQTRLEVLSKEQAEHVDRLKLYLRSEKVSFQDALVYFVLSGIELKSLRESSTHGNTDPENSFKKLCESNFPELNKASIYRRIHLVEACEKLPSNFLSKAQIADGKIPDSVRTPILKEIHEHSDGKSITAVLRDLDIIRQPEVPGTYERKPRDLKKLIDEAGVIDDGAVKEWCSDTLMLLDAKSVTLGEQKTATLQKMENIRLQLGQRIQKILKSRGGASARSLAKTTKGSV